MSITEEASRLEQARSALPATWIELLPNYSCPVLGLIVLYSFLVHDNFFMVIWLSYVVIPLLDIVMPLDNFN